MPRKDGAFIKLERIKQIRSVIIRQFPEDVSVDKVLSWAEVNIGLRRDTARQYLEMIVDNEGWIVSDGKIVISFDEEVSPDE